MHYGWWMSMRQGDEKPKVTKQLLLRVLAYARGYWWHIAGMLVTILLTTGLSLLTPLIFRNMIDVVIPAKDVTRLVWLGVALLAIPALTGVVNVFQRRFNASVGEGVIYDLRSALFSRLQRMSLRFFTNTKSGELMSRLNNDVVGAQNAISNTIVNIVTNLIEAIALLAVMLTMQWQLTLISILILPLFIIAAQRLGNVLRDIARQAMETNAQMNAHMNETLNIGGALLVKLFGRTREEENRFRQRAASVRDIGIRRAVVGSSFFVIFGLITAVGTALVYGLGGWYVIAGAFTVGTIVAFGSYLGQLYSALQGLAGAPVEFSTSMVSFERVFEVIDLPQDIIEKENAMSLRDVRGELEFEDVSFDYHIDPSKLLKDVKRYGRHEDVGAVLSLTDKVDKSNGKKKDDEAASTSGEADSTSQAREVALERISFVAHPGQLIALVGPSGAGKTTTTYLIPRLYDPTDGVIRIDGHDLRDVTLESLSSAIGMVTQETYLFHDTIRTNLTYAKIDATQSEIESAARAANIHNFIMDLPDGYDTIVGERGYRLSGGEKQRIALARVILKDPRILVLDEATSHLDSESESLIQEALKRVMAGRTSIVIAHRLSTILAADLILVMDRGKIVESGTHDELIALNGLYAQLYETQFRGERV
ncbi:MAG TPA: ABC transporter ATP-binding protein [Anaerolineales bacterium]|nr:ABC transporter ATP-binding protein [Anaerolineales bacterium]HMS01094.1 ABC transporter ATP-binding protein [Anaerolineales bacterium]HNQ94595.1 ABC transporter ATP-binding protein [Anaerolineales bacterium]HNS60027.1 ABC transporter ATP-binding protein [Anaerolineales bacterium]